MPIRLTQEDWHSFERLDGSPQDNFEALWRALVLSNYEGKGRFLEYKNHPGVEFLLQLSNDVSGLGPSGCTIGWQCKFFASIRAGKSLTRGQKRIILDSFAKSKAQSSSIEKWILCIPGKLTKEDVDWLHLLSTDDTEVLEWTDADIDRHLNMSECGPHLREAYFGGLRLSESDLKEAFEWTFAPLQKRWIPEVHVRSPEENEIRRHLLEPVSWEPLSRSREELADLRQYFVGKKDELDSIALHAIDDCNAQLQDVLDTLSSGSLRPFESFKEWVGATSVRVSQHIILLRSRRDVRSWPLSNIEQTFRFALSQLESIEKESKVPVVSVMADAGWGKTHLAASILQFCEGRRKGGLLLLAKDLGESDDFNTLVHKVHLPGGRSFQNEEALLSALHEFGNRHQCRVPLVVDGLNESQNPSAWKTIISHLSALLGRYTNVLLVVTFRTGYCSSWSRFGHTFFGDPSIRTAYKEMCIPADVPCFEASFVNEARSLVTRYFDYYRIDYHGSIPNILRHPLTLRLFCETTNPKRQTTVRPTTLPSDTSAIFDSFCESAAKHIEEHVKPSFRRPYQEYRAHIRRIGKLLWENGNRFASVSVLKQQFPETLPGWEYDWANVLSQEGLILTRPDWNNIENTVFEAAYDPFGGFLIADYLTTQYSSGLKEYLTGPSFHKNVVENGHPLSEDILSFLTWLYPLKNYAQMLFDIAPGSIRERVLHKTLDCDERYLNEETLEAFREEAKSNIEFAKRCYEKAWSRLFDLDSHLNAKFLDSILTDLPPVTRDEQWGLWLFNNRREMFAWLGDILNQVPEVDEPFVESLFLLSKWLLGSIVISIRDRASRLLVLLGERYPERVLALVSKSLQNNDHYIVERLTGVAYGIMMSLFATRELDILKKAGGQYVRSAECTLIAADSPNVTINAVALESIANAKAILQGISCGSSPQDGSFSIVPYFVSTNPFRSPDKTNPSDRNQVRWAIHPDFENYTLTRVLGLRAYDTGGERYAKMRAQFEQRMFDIGYRYSLFESIDREIQEGRHDRPYQEQYLYLERFGKKYANIVFHEMLSLVKGHCHSVRRSLSHLVDPSFPGMAMPLEGEFLKSCFPEPQDVESWILNGPLPHCSDGFEKTFPDEGSDDWVLISGIFDQTAQDGKRVLFSMFDGFFLKKGVLRQLMSDPEVIPNSPLPSRYYCYHLETPWSFHYRFDEEDPEKDLSKACPITVTCTLYPENPRKGERRTIQCEVPAEWYSMESNPHDSDESPQGMLLSHYIALRLDLRPVPHRWEFCDCEGRLAARYFKKGDSLNGYWLLYLRKDLLARYLEIENTEFVIVFHGERRMAPSEYGKHDKFFKDEPRDVGSFYEFYRFTKSGFKRVSKVSS